MGVIDVSYLSFTRNVMTNAFLTIANNYTAARAPRLRLNERGINAYVARVFINLVAKLPRHWCPRSSASVLASKSHTSAGRVRVMLPRQCGDASESVNY
jgi:hypothetical protein